jgi:ABC-type arginine transport system permease subunit
VEQVDCWIVDTQIIYVQREENVYPLSTKLWLKRIYYKEILGLVNIAISNDNLISNVFISIFVSYNLLSGLHFVNWGYNCFFMIVRMIPLLLVLMVRGGKLYLVDFAMHRVNPKTYLVAKFSMKHGKISKG